MNDQKTKKIVIISTSVVLCAAIVVGADCLGRLEIKIITWLQKIIPVSYIYTNYWDNNTTYGMYSPVIPSRCIRKMNRLYRRFMSR